MRVMDTKPQWFAHLKEWLHGAASAKARPAIERRSAELEQRWHVLDEEDWRKLEYQIRAAIVREARTHCPPDATDCLAAIDRALELLDAETPWSDPAWEKAAEAAWAAWEAAMSRTSARAAAAGAKAADLAASSSAREAGAAAWAAEAASAAAAWAAAAWAEAWTPARSAAAGRMITAIFDAIEKAISARQ